MRDRAWGVRSPADTAEVEVEVDGVDEDVGECQRSFFARLFSMGISYRRRGLLIGSVHSIHRSPIAHSAS